MSGHSLNRHPKSKFELLIRKTNFKSVFIMVDVDYVHSLSIKTFKNILQGHLQMLSNSKIQTCYMSVHGSSIEYSKNEIVKIWKVVFCVLQVYCHHIVELTLECGSAILFHTYMCPTIDVYMKHKFPRAKLRISIPESLRSEIPSIWAELPQNTCVDMSVVLGKDDVGDFQESFTPILQDTHSSLLHISFEWKGDKLTIRNIREEISDYLARYDMYGYQTWHYASKKEESQHLKNLYAMYSYHAFCIASPLLCHNKEHNIITWIESTKFEPAYILTQCMSAFHTPDYDIEKIEIEEELQLRILRALDSQFLYLPLHMKKYYALQAKNEYLTQELTVKGFEFQGLDDKYEIWKCRI